jgi:hypothetical protein
MDAAAGDGGLPGDQRELRVAHETARTPAIRARSPVLLYCLEIKVQSFAYHLSRPRGLILYRIAVLMALVSLVSARSTDSSSLPGRSAHYALSHDPLTVLRPSIAHESNPPSRSHRTPSIGASRRGRRCAASTWCLHAGRSRRGVFARRAHHGLASVTHAFPCRLAERT